MPCRISVGGPGWSRRPGCRGTLGPGRDRPPFWTARRCEPCSTHMALGVELSELAETEASEADGVPGFATSLDGLVRQVLAPDTALGRPHCSRSTCRTSTTRYRPTEWPPWCSSSRCCDDCFSRTARWSSCPSNPRPVHHEPGHQVGLCPELRERRLATMRVPTLTPAGAVFWVAPARLRGAPPVRSVAVSAPAGTGRTYRW